MTKKEAIFFVKRLAFLLAAGISVSDALHTLLLQAKKSKARRMLETFVSDVSEGKTLSQSLAKFPRVFDAFVVHSVALGEESGRLNENLRYIAEQLFKKEQIRKKVIGAFVYPIIVIFLTLGITLFLLLYLFPKIMPVFVSLRVTLPLSTRILLAVSTFLVHYGIMFALVIVACVVAFVFWYRKDVRVRYYVALSTLRVPLARTLAQGYVLAQLSRSLGLMLASGISLPESCLALSKTMPNEVVKASCAAFHDATLSGKQISETASAWKHVYPDLFVGMCAVGERSGHLAETLISLGEFYEQEVEDFTKNLSSLVEPVLMVAMGVIVGFVAISIITPIYGLTEHLHA